MIYVILLCLIIYAIIFIKLRMNNKFIIDKFKDNNVIVFGAKGTGKDLLMQMVIKNRKEPYFSNVYYGYKYMNIDVKDISVEPNTYEQFINNEIVQIEKVLNREGVDIYLSDAGVYLPSQYDYLLNKNFKSFPIYYALSRHLYNQNIHLNTQALNRVWLKIREQADHYIKCRGVFKFGKWLFIKVRYYSEYESANSDKLPLRKVGLFNKYNRADIAEFEANNGIIRDMLCYINIKYVKYDTRYFHNLLFGYSFKKTKDNKNKINLLHKLSTLWSKATSRRKAETLYKSNERKRVKKSNERKRVKERAKRSERQRNERVER